MERGDRPTRLSRAFCSAHFRDVPVLVAEPPDDRSGSSGAVKGSAARGVPRVRDADHPDPEASNAARLVTCLDYGVRCTGWLCPLFALPTLPAHQLLLEAAEAERLRRAGGGPPSQPR